MAEVQGGAANDWSWLETRRSVEKLDSGSPTTALAFHDQPANDGFRFLPLTAQGTLLPDGLET